MFRMFMNDQEGSKRQKKVSAGPRRFIGYTEGSRKVKRVHESSSSFMGEGTFINSDVIYKQLLPGA